VFTPGAHGTTFGGNLLACAAATAALRVLADPATLEHATAMGARLHDGLVRLAARHPRITTVRGLGLMLGAVFDRPCRDVAERCLARGLLVNCTADRVLRFLPPLVVTAAQLDEGLAVLDEALAA
jgi:acetylornithine/succinyldiaminopimelate/putrescine aminotransferase